MLFNYKAQPERGTTKTFYLTDWLTQKCVWMTFLFRTIKRIWVWGGVEDKGKFLYLSPEPQHRDVRRMGKISLFQEVEVTTYFSYHKFKNHHADSLAARHLSASHVWCLQGSWDSASSQDTRGSATAVGREHSMQQNQGCRWKEVRWVWTY